MQLHYNKWPLWLWLFTGGLMRTSIISLLTAMVLAGSMAMAAVQNPLGKNDVLATLTKLRDESHNKIVDLETKIQKSIDLNMNPDEVTAPASDKEIQQIRLEIVDTKFKLELINRLIFQVDTRWKEQGEFKKFLSTTVQELAKQEATNTEKDGNWTYISQLGVILKETASDRGENPLALLEDYLRESTLQKIVKPKDFLAKRHYSNGKMSTQTEGPSKENVGDVVDKKIKAL